MRRLLPLILFLAIARPAAAELRAGAAAVDVTPDRLPAVVNCMFPERTANAVSNRLHARGLVLDDGTTRLAIVIVDSCMMPRELLDRAKKLAQEATKIPVENMLVAATHTHSAPSAMGCLGSDADPAYPEFLETRIAKCVEQAAKKLAPARAGWAVARAPDHTHNRRWVLRPDKVREDPFGNPTVRANMHPGYQHPDFVGPSGPVDPALSLLAIQTPDGQPVAVLANFSMHYFGSTPLSSDYFGVFCDRLAERIGGEKGPRPLVIMSQGTSGDLMWMDYGKPEAKRKVEDYAGELADIAHKAYAKVEYRDADLAMKETKLTLGRRTPDEAQLARARETVGKLNGRKPTTQPDIYAREAVFLHDEPKRELKLQAVRVGGLGIAGIPDEVFALTGLRLKAVSPLEPTFVIELANGAEGYIPPPAQHALGGYTTWPARTAALEVEAEPKIVESVLGLLEGVAGRKRRTHAEPASPFAEAVMAAKPLAYWRLDEFHGPTARDAIGKSHGTYEAGVAHYLPGPDLGGGVNRCPHFAGGRVTAALKGLGGRYSAEMWVWNGLPADARPVTGYVFSRGPNDAKGAPGDHLGIGGTAGHAGKLVFSNGTQTLGGKTELPPRTWHHVALVRDGKAVTVYLDGQVEITGEAEVTVPAGDESVFLGGRSDGFANLAGKLDEVAVYSRALKADEVRARAGVRKD